MSKFVHLHVHSDFSLLDGYGNVGEYSKKATKNNVPYLCITDHGMGAAYPRMIDECKKNNLTPIFGCEVYVNNNHHLVPEFSSLSDEMKKKVRKNNHLVLIAKNNKGYENLVKLISEGWINGFYYKPRISWDLIKKYSEGLICTSACLGSEISQFVLNDDMENAYKIAAKYKEVWPEDYYIEYQMLKMEEQDKVNVGLIKIAEDLNIPTVVTNDVHYCEEEDSYNHRIQLMLNSRGTISNPGNFEFHTDQLWYKTEQEMDEIWRSEYKDHIPEHIHQQSKENTYEICQKCNVHIDTSPKFPVIEKAAENMIKQCFEELKKRGLNKNKEYMERLHNEYQMITEKEYPSYFMLVKQVIDWAKEQGWSVGAGRGCFLPDSIVICKKEEKKIQEINNTDIVLSHTGNYNKVINNFAYDIDEEIIDITTEDKRKISCTIDHEIYIKRKNKYKWIQAKNLIIGDDILDLTEKYN